MKVSTIKKDIIPFRAGVVILTPLNKKTRKPDYALSTASKYDFLTSTQTSVTRTTEMLANGNGQDKEYILDETYNLTVVGNTFDPVFHGVVTGRLEAIPTNTLVPRQFTFNVPPEPEAGQSTFRIEFGTDKIEPVPAADSDGNYNFIVEDSYGNTLMRAEQTSLGTYMYDPDTKSISLSADYKDEEIRVIYYYSSSNSLEYRSNPILQQPEYQIDVFGVSTSASTNEKYLVHTKILRATTTGDVAEQTTQKSKSAPITYTFRSTPVPENVSAYVQTFTPMNDSQVGIKNIVNGLDDDTGSGGKGPTIDNPEGDDLI